MVKNMLKNCYINVTLVLNFHWCGCCPVPLDACGTGCLSPPAISCELGSGRKYKLKLKLDKLERS